MFVAFGVLAIAALITVFSHFQSKNFAAAYGCGFRDGVYDKDPDSSCVFFRQNAVEHKFPQRP
jgi:hypothetical protein